MHIWVSACVRVGTTVFSRYLGAISCCISRRKGSGTHARTLQRHQTQDSLLDLLALGACRDGRLERLRHFVRVSNEPRLHRLAHRAAHPTHTPPAASANRHHLAPTAALGWQRPPAPCGGPCSARQWAMCAAATRQYRIRPGRLLPSTAAHGAGDGVRRRAMACGSVRRQQGEPVGDARALHARSLHPLNWCLWYRGVKGPGSDQLCAQVLPT